ncbi:MAG: hypothetical protein ACI9FR_000077 [Cryomorphaceae bacterium]|jgi:hypothetical protein
MRNPKLLAIFSLRLKLAMALICSFVCLPTQAQLAELVWAEVGSENNVIEYSQWDGETWSDPIHIYENSNEIATPSLATQADGTKVLIWTEQQRRKSVLMWEKRGSTDEEWSQASVFSRFGNENVSPSLVTDFAGTLWVFWSAQQSDLSDVFVSKQHAGSWSEPIQVNAVNKVPDIKPLAQILEDGTVQVEWQSYDFEVGDYVLRQKSFSGDVKTSQTQPEGEFADMDPQKVSLPSFVSGQIYVTMHLPKNQLIQSYRIEPNVSAR